MRTFLARCATIIFLPVVAAMASVPAEARDRWHDRRGGDDAAVAIGAGIVGLALGAAIASSGRDRDDYYYYDEGHYYPRAYHARPYPRYYAHPAYVYPHPAYGYPRYERRGWRGDGWRWRGDGWRHRERRWRY